MHAFPVAPFPAVALQAIAILLGVVPLAVVLCAGGPAPSAPRTRTVTILHTSDLHGHLTPWQGWEGELEGRTVGGMDRIAGLARAVRAERGAGNVLLLDSGDAIGDTMIADLTQGGVVIDAMNAAGYDAMTFGNHEPDYGIARLRELMQKAAFPLVAVNMFVEPGNERFARPYTTLRRAGAKIAIVGYAYPNTAMTTARENVEGVRFVDAPEAVGRAVAEARGDGAALVVVLSHAGLAADRRLASLVPGIDVIVGGHTHNEVSEPLREGATLIVQAGAHGSHVGRLDVQLCDGSIVGSRRRLIPVDHASVPADPGVARLLDDALAPHRAALQARVGEAAAPIVRAQTLAGREPVRRDQLSPADALFAGILRQRTGADIALLPGVGYGVAIPRGAIAADALRNLIPHASRVVVLTLSGRQIRKILEQSIENVYTERASEKVGGMIQVSGLSFAYDSSKPRGARLVEVRAGERALDADRDFRVATNGMLAEGGHNYRTFLEGRNRSEGEEVYEVVKSWLLTAGPVSTPATDAIRKVTTSPGKEAAGTAAGKEER